MRKLVHSAVQLCGMAGVRIQTVTSTGIRGKMTIKQCIQTDDSTENSGNSSKNCSRYFVEVGVFFSYKISIKSNGMKSSSDEEKN